MMPSGEPPAAPAPVAPSTADRVRAVLVAGWGTATARAALVFAVMAALGQAVGFLFLILRDVGDAGTAFRLGWVYYALFHRVGVVFDVEGLSVPGTGVPGGSFDLTYRLGGGLLLFMALAAWLLARAGRALGEKTDGGPVLRALHGAKVGVPYAALSTIGLLLLRFDLEGPGEPFFPGDLFVRASLAGSVLMPLALGGAFGAIGGWRSAPRPEPGSWFRRAEDSVAGGWRMLALGLVLAFLGLLVNAVADPDATAAYFRAATEGSASDAALFFGHHVALLPNQSLFVLAPAMGGCDGVYGSGFSFDLLCYWRFPSADAFGGVAENAAAAAGLIPTFDMPGAPAAYYLFLLVPLAAALIGGRRAAVDARTRIEATALGVAAGVVFGALVFVGALLSGLSARGSAGLGLGFGGSITFRLGPEQTSAFLLGLAWGVVGGAVGAVIGARGLPVRTVPPADASAPSTGPASNAS